MVSMHKITMQPLPCLASEQASKRVLIADDSPTVCKIVEISLQRAGYEVVSYGDGAEALTALLTPGALLPDVLLLDLEMPRMNGYQLAQACLRRPQLARIPLVVLSRRTGVVDRLKARLCHVRAYLTKPFTEQELLALVTTLMEPRQPIGTREGGGR